MFYKQYPKSRCYNLREDGITIKYLQEYIYTWEKAPNVKYTDLDYGVTHGAPGMYLYERKAFDVIRGIDVGVTKNGVETIAKVRQIEALEKRALWRPSSILSDIETMVACRPEHLHETGVAELIYNIKHAKNITIYGFAGDTFFDSYNNVQISFIDDMTIDLDAGNVSRSGVDILTIPKAQVYAVADALNYWRRAAMYGHIMR